MKILVTGGAGFIGSNFIRHALSMDGGHEIIAFDDLSTGHLSNLENLRATFVEGTLADLEAVCSVAEGADVILHLGALGSVPRSIDNPLGSHVANLSGTLNVLEAARKNSSYVVFASSSSVYGANTKLPKSELDWTRPMSPYAVTKLGAEGYVLAYQYAYGLRTLAFRFFNVYGPKQAANHTYAAVVPKFIDAALKGKALELHGDGHQSRDFTFVDTVCAILYEAITKRTVSRDPVNLAFGTNTKLLELVSIIEKVSGSNLSIKHISPRPGDVRASQADGERIRKLFPTITPVSLEDGLRKTFAWFRGDSN